MIKTGSSDICLCGFYFDIYVNIYVILHLIYYCWCYCNFVTAGSVTVALVLLWCMPF